jgi:hypothetical protein
MAEHLVLARALSPRRSLMTPADRCILLMMAGASLAVLDATARTGGRISRPRGLLISNDLKRGWGRRSTLGADVGEITRPVGGQRRRGVDGFMEGGGLPEGEGEDDGVPDPGGRLDANGCTVSAGPTVGTRRWLFDPAMVAAGERVSYQQGNRCGCSRLGMILTGCSWCCFYE